MMYMGIMSFNVKWSFIYICDIELQKHFRKSNKARVWASNICQEAIQCIKTVRTFANESDEADRYRDSLIQENALFGQEDIHHSIMRTVQQVLHPLDKVRFYQ